MPWYVRPAWYLLSLALLANWLGLEATRFVALGVAWAVLGYAVFTNRRPSATNDEKG
jgi:hypothetical protein